jgi:hypothetical protein
VPANARSLLVVCDDADAFGRSVPILGGYNIPPDWTALERGGFQQAINDFNEPGYAGPCPPRGEKAHAYHFRLAALRTVLNDTGPGANCDAIKRLAAPDEIAFVELIGFYGRSDDQDGSVPAADAFLRSRWRTHAQPREPHATITVQSSGKHILTPTPRRRPPSDV